MSSLFVRGPARLRGFASLPSDKSVAHRALLLAGIATGTSRIRVRDLGGDNRSTLAAIEAMGIRTSCGASEIVVEGAGLRGLRAPGGALDAGNSGTTMRLLCGLLAGQAFAARIGGDASLTRRPMGRVVLPLRQMRARIEGREEGGDVRPPLVLEGLRPGERLRGIEHRSPIPSAQVKSALLLAGLYAEGQTLVAEPIVSRDHTERALRSMGAPIATFGASVGVDPEGWDGRLSPMDLDLPGDLSAAAFLLAATFATGSGPVVIDGVGVNPTRTGILDAFRDMGGRFTVVPKGDSGGEPVAEIHAQGGLVGGARVGGELFVRLVDEVPALVAAAATVDSVTEVRDAAELRVKESDRIALLVSLVRAFGLEAEELADGLRMRGGRTRPARVSSGGDHRIAMAAAVLGLVTEGETVVDDVACIGTSFPGFVATMRTLGADMEERS